MTNAIRWRATPARGAGSRRPSYSPSAAFGRAGAALAGSLPEPRSGRLSGECGRGPVRERAFGLLQEGTDREGRGAIAIAKTRAGERRRSERVTQRVRRALSPSEVAGSDRARAP